MGHLVPILSPGSQGRTASPKENRNRAPLAPNPRAACFGSPRAFRSSMASVAGQAGGELRAHVTLSRFTPAAWCKESETCWAPRISGACNSAALSEDARGMARSAARTGLHTHQLQRKENVVASLCLLNLWERAQWQSPHGMWSPAGMGSPRPPAFYNPKEIGRRVCRSLPSCLSR